MQMDSLSDSQCTPESLTLDLASWTHQHNVTRSALNDLLAVTFESTWTFSSQRYMYCAKDRQQSAAAGSVVWDKTQIVI